MLCQTTCYCISLFLTVTPQTETGEKKLRCTKLDRWVGVYLPRSQFCYFMLHSKLNTWEEVLPCLGVITLFRFQEEGSSGPLGATRQYTERIICKANLISISSDISTACTNSCTNTTTHTVVLLFSLLVLQTYCNVKHFHKWLLPAIFTLWELPCWLWETSSVLSLFGTEDRVLCS